MKFHWAAVLWRIPSIVCFGGAIYIMAIGIEFGWGWLIFAGICGLGGIEIETRGE